MFSPRQTDGVDFDYLHAKTRRSKPLFVSGKGKFTVPSSNDQIVRFSEKFVPRRHANFDGRVARATDT